MLQWAMLTIFIFMTWETQIFSSISSLHTFLFCYKTKIKRISWIRSKCPLSVSNSQSFTVSTLNHIKKYKKSKKIFIKFGINSRLKAPILKQMFSPLIFTFIHWTWLSSNCVFFKWTENIFHVPLPFPLFLTRLMKKKTWNLLLYELYMWEWIIN